MIAIGIAKILILASNIRFQCERSTALVGHGIGRKVECNSLPRRVFLFVAMQMLFGLAKSTVTVQDIAQRFFNISVVAHACLYLT